MAELMKPFEANSHPHSKENKWSEEYSRDLNYSSSNINQEGDVKQYGLYTCCIVNVQLS